MKDKGRVFTGLCGGACYDRFAALFGMKAPFYRKALGALVLGARERALDLGCGPGSMMLLLASRSHEEARIWGIVWFPLCCWGEGNKDNWNNVYPRLCREQGLLSEADGYINSIARRQLFRKGPALSCPSSSGEEVFSVAAVAGEDRRE